MSDVSSIVPTNWIEMIFNGGAFALLAFVLLYGMKYANPQLVDQMQGTIDRNTKALEHQQKMLARLTVCLIQHDATVKGANPETLGTTDELFRRVLETNGD